MSAVEIEIVPVGLEDIGGRNVTEILIKELFNKEGKKKEGERDAADEAKV